MRVSERHRRHAAHRVACEGQLARGRHRLDHGIQVLAQLIDVVADRSALSGPTVAALVPHDNAVSSSFEGPTLQHPTLRCEAIAVRENDSRLGQTLEGFRRTRWMIDAHMEGDAVVGDHDVLFVVRLDQARILG